MDKSQIDVLMFADDIVIFSETAKGLQRQLDTMEMLFSNLHLLKKTKVCAYGNAKQQPFKCGGAILESVDSYKYLGVWMIRDNKPCKAIKSTCLQAKRVIFALKQSLLKLNLPPVPVSITKHSSALYIGMAKVLPIIDVLGYMMGRILHFLLLFLLLLQI